jgi:hypothetical protein
MFLPRVCTASPVMTLDVLLQDWTLIQRQYEENSSYKLNKTTSQEDCNNERSSESSAAYRKSTTSYPFDEAARSWNRVLPK